MFFFYRRYYLPFKVSASKLQASVSCGVEDPLRLKESWRFDAENNCAALLTKKKVPRSTSVLIKKKSLAAYALYL